jgi:hypothetical protein
MKTTAKFFVIILIIPIIFSLTTVDGSWLSVKQKNFIVYYTQSDQQNKNEYLKIFNKGVKSVKVFFGSQFKNDFEIYIHPQQAIIG